MKIPEPPTKQGSRDAGTDKSAWISRLAERLFGPAVSNEAQRSRPLAHRIIVLLIVIGVGAYLIVVLS